MLRMDNGLEFISHELTQWAAKQDTVEAFIPPGMPWHNRFVDSFHNRLRDKLLEDEMCETLPMRRAACDCGRSAIIPSFEPRVYPAD